MGRRPGATTVKASEAASIAAPRPSVLAAIAPSPFFAHPNASSTMPPPITWAANGGSPEAGPSTQNGNGNGNAAGGTSTREGSPDIEILEAKLGEVEFTPEMVIEQVG